MRERRERNVQSQYDFAFCEIVLVLGKSLRGQEGNADLAAGSALGHLVVGVPNHFRIFEASHIRSYSSYVQRIFFVSAS